MSAEYEHETEVGKILHELMDDGLFNFFETRNYSEAQFEIFAVLSCLSPESEAKQRIRYSNSEEVLYCDIMLDYDELVNANRVQKKDFVAAAILEQLPKILAKYPSFGFDTSRFSHDLKSWFSDNGWLSEPS